MPQSLQQRNERLRSLLSPLPGRQPYDNVRPIRIPARLDGWQLIDCVCELHPPIGRVQWETWFAEGLIRRFGLIAQPMMHVRGGFEFEHVFPDTVEPDVSADVTIIHEDESFIAVNKPAPLPLHPSGRFERNTLVSFLRLIYNDEKLRPVHRLDANTSGLVLIARTSAAATFLAQQFESGAVEKRYLAKCYGEPDDEVFECEAAISVDRCEGGTRTVDPKNGKAAKTRFRKIFSFSDGTSLVLAKPITGRTNQIRIHLWSLGYPIVGDPTYRPGNQIAAQQTLSVTSPPMCLHAIRLQFIDPTSRKAISLRVPSPTWADRVQDAFSFSASDSSLEISSSNSFNSDGSSA
ncbi:MAG: RluA family pseudouridine synthase [Planctomycetota bacterium]